MQTFAAEMHLQAPVSTHTYYNKSSASRRLLLRHIWVASDRKASYCCIIPQVQREDEKGLEWSEDEWEIKTMINEADEEDLGNPLKHEKDKDSWEGKYCEGMTLKIEPQT